MMLAAVQVPAGLLLSPDLPASAKLVWMVNRLHAAGGRAGTGWLCSKSGLTRPTVLQALAQLTAAGWAPGQPGDQGRTVLVPAELLTNRTLGALARVVYGLLPLTSRFAYQGGQVSYADLAGLAHSGRKAVARALAELALAEWVTLHQAHRLAPVQFTMTFPGLIRGLDEIARVQDHFDLADYHGEALMREYAAVLVDSDEFEDHATPGFLVNPKTKHELEFDRFYPLHRVALEFNGPQHYRKTRRFTVAQVAAQRERDIWKAGICSLRGITLVIVHPEDLSLVRMRKKVEGLLPLRDWTKNGLLIEFLEYESRKYQGIMAKI